MAFVGFVKPGCEPLKLCRNNLRCASNFVSSDNSENSKKSLYFSKSKFKKKADYENSREYLKNKVYRNSTEKKVTSFTKNESPFEKKESTFRKNDKAFTKDETPFEEEEDTFRKNDMNIQMLSKNLYKQIFPNVNKKKSSPEAIKAAQNKLKKHGLWMDDINYLKDVSLKLPPLKGADIEEHFWNIGKEQSEPYKKLVSDFIKNGIPEHPSEWVFQKGWTKYVPGELPKAVPFPDEKIMVFDVEVCVKLGDLPTLATAVSENAWYGWVSSDVIEGKDVIPSTYYNTNGLISFESRSVGPCLLVGHNVSYDRARIKEEYNLKNSGLMFLDTMSLHICIGGVARSQKAMMKQGVENYFNDFLRSCFTSLKDVYQLYCNGTLEKELRNVFVEGTILDVKNNFQELMTYCSNDTKATFEVLQAIFPIFLHRFPHPVTLAGMLEMNTGFLPVNNNWKKYLAEADQTYEDVRNEITFELTKKSDNACKLFHNEQYKNDLWMFTEDWTTQQLKLTKRKLKEKTEAEVNKTSQENLEEKTEQEVEEIKLQKQFQSLFDLGELLPKVRPYLPGYPLWYRNLCEKPKSKDLMPSLHLSTGMVVTPKLLKLTWENFPLYYTREYGWGILVADIYAKNVNTSVPFSKLLSLTNENCKKLLDASSHDCIETSSQNTNGNVKEVPYYRGSGVWCNYVLDDCCYFFKLPHKDGIDKNVGTPLAKDFSNIFSESSLFSSDSIAKKILNLSKKSHYWMNNRERIKNQMVVWLNKKEAPILNSIDEISIGIIIPKVVVCGTLTRRAMESTWLTASKTIDERIGSELRSMVQAPPGYHLVGADVDSQELWIASLLGDSSGPVKEHGATPLGWMTLSGTKAKKTDMHSKTAESVGISREHAKVLNYARIYGAGMPYSQKLLQNFNPSMSDEEAKEKTIKMFSITKGRRLYKVKDSAKSEVEQHFGTVLNLYDSRSQKEMCKKLEKKWSEIFEKFCWVDGTESDMFNELERIANSTKPVTPFLQSRLSRALELNDDYTLNTRMNWVVQSGAVDFLHLMLVCMKWLTNGEARYCFSFHDEVRYMVPSEKRYETALAMHITNLLVRAFCSSRLELYDLPQSVAFFSSVEIDKALRKEAHDDCVTPSNPHGLEKGYGIPPGESLNIYEVIEKTGGSLSFSNNEKTSFQKCLKQPRENTFTGKYYKQFLKPLVKTKKLSE